MATTLMDLAPFISGDASLPGHPRYYLNSSVGVLFTMLFDTVI